MPASESTARVLQVVHAATWVVAIVAYVAVLVTSLTGGGSDLWAVGKASVSALAVALIGRLSMVLLARADFSAEPPAPPEDPVEFAEEEDNSLAIALGLDTRTSAAMESTR